MVSAKGRNGDLVRYLCVASEGWRTVQGCSRLLITPSATLDLAHPQKARRIALDIAEHFRSTKVPKRWSKRRRSDLEGDFGV